jgi:hypothetical protein
MFLAALELVLLLVEHLAGQQTKLSIFGTSYDVLRTEPSSYLFSKRICTADARRVAVSLRSKGHENLKERRFCLVQDQLGP